MKLPMPLAAVWCSLAVFAQTPTVTFRTGVRLVEVYATVLDHKGRYIDGISRDQFEITDNGVRQDVVSFLNDSAEFSCALLLDTTGSMSKSLPVVRGAIARLIDELRDSDWVAVYGFSTGLETLQEFTHDTSAAKRAAFRTRAQGRTALYDAVAKVAADIARRTGKKAVIVFTDGDDNASVLNMRGMVERSRQVGVPIYAVAAGDALKSAGLLRNLKEMAALTGAKAYTAKQAHDVEGIMQDIVESLQHTYLLTYRAPDAHDDSWRHIAVAVPNSKDAKVRAKEGYFP